MYSWDKKELEKGSRAVTIVPGAIDNIYEIKTNIKRPTLKFIEAVFHVDIPGRTSPMPTCAGWLPMKIRQIQA